VVLVEDAVESHPDTANKLDQGGGGASAETTPSTLGRHYQETDREGGGDATHTSLCQSPQAIADKHRASPPSAPWISNKRSPWSQRT